jgi:hypothetical protein
LQDDEVRASNNWATVTIPKVFLNQSDESKEAARELTTKAPITEANAANTKAEAEATAAAMAAAEAEAEATERATKTSVAVKPAGTKQKQQSAATAEQATAAHAKEGARRCIMSFAGARALLVGAAVLFAVAIWSPSSGASTPPAGRLTRASTRAGG